MPILVPSPGVGDNGPLHVPNYLDLTGLFQLADGEVRTLFEPGVFDWSNAQLADRLLERLAGSVRSTFLSTGLLIKDSSNATLDPARLREIRSACGDQFLCYVQSYRSLLELLPEPARDSSEFVSLQKYGLISYYFFFASQDGFAFRAHPCSWEGKWSALSLLIDRSREEPLQAGFHGIDGVRLVEWEAVEKSSSQAPIVYVSSGTHSFYESKEAFELTTRVGALTPEDLAGYGLVTGAGAGIFLLGAVGGGVLLILLSLAGLPVGGLAALVLGMAGLFVGLAIVAALLFLLASLWDWLEDEDGSRSTGGSVGEEEQRNAELLTGGEQRSSDESDPWAAPNSAVAAEDVASQFSGDETGSRVRPSGFVHADDTSWWNSGLSWGDLDTAAPQLQRLRPGRPRDTHAELFALFMIDRLVR